VNEIILCSGYVPPEYVRNGVYSIKSDVYSFGIVLLHIISGKKNGSLYGSDETLSLLEYVSFLITQLTIF
jgi:chitinase